MDNKGKTIFVGIGEVDDPLPEEPKNTKYWVFCGACPVCQSNGRLLLPRDEKLFLICEECGHKQDSSVEKNDLQDLTYVYWCNSSKFQTDILEEDSNQSKELLEFLNNFQEIEIPRWAVKIENGICCKSNQCINFFCVYHKNVNSGEKL